MAIDLPAELKRRARVLAARRDLTLQEYLRHALDRLIEQDLAQELDAADDPVLADLWNNDADAVYDDLLPR